jgi:PAS domain S-box-containing protein
LEAANLRLKDEIEKHQKTETALRESEAKFKGIVDLAMSAIISIDMKQLILLFNQGAERIFGYKAEEVLGKPLDLLLPVACRQLHREHVENFEDDFRDTRKMGERSKQVFGRRKNGEEFPASASISKLKLQSGTIFTVMLQDISDRVFAEEELRRTIEQQKAIAQQLEKAKEAAESASRAKSEFLANMSHEIRTPLNAILGFSDLLSEAIAEPKAQTYVKSIASSGKALLAIVNDILDLSKIEAGKLELHYEPVNLRSLVEEIEKMFSYGATQKAISLRTDIGETVPAGINCDEVRLRQILFNLVGNAIKFTERGYVKITVALLESTPPIIKTENNPHCSLPNVVWLKMAVEDTGIGIPAEQQERIFGSFVQSEGQSNRKYGGSGLGLAITKRLTEMLGGAIALESEPAKGSTFTCYFPAVTLLNYSQEEAIAADEDEDLEQFPPLTVLVADDVQSNLELIEGYFAGSKHQLLLAKDGREAIALARLIRPDLILMDLRMPNMDGKEAIKYLKQEPTTKDIPIAIVSASVQEVDLQDIGNFYSGFLLKPITRSEVVAELKKICSFQGMDNTPDVTTVPEEINPPNQAKLRELLVKLRSYEAEVWPQLLETMKMRELREFAECLKQWGIEYECSSLLAYATAVETQVVEFDWDKLPNTVAAFPEVLRSRLIVSC